MFWSALYLAVTLLVNTFRLHRLALDDKDLEILLLRQQLVIVRRKQQRGPHISRFEKLLLVTLLSKVTDTRSVTRHRLKSLILIFQPETALRWHRELVKHKWSFRKGSNRGGRPRVDSELVSLVLRLARENEWGGGKIAGELRKLGYQLTSKTVLNILKRHDLPILHKRMPNATTWKPFLTHYKEYLVAISLLSKRSVSKRSVLH